MKRDEVTTALRDLERAAADLQQAHQAALARGIGHRLHHVPPRQPADVEMCHALSAWLCAYWQRHGVVRALMA